MSATPHKRPLLLSIAMMLIIALTASTATLTAAQESLIPVDAPVDIHSGTCSDIVAEPAYDGGQIAATTTDDMWDDETFQTGIFEDEQLGASGIDFNNDGMLQAEEVITPNGVSVEMGHAEGDLGGDVSTDEPYVVVVHASPDAYDTYLACGTIEGAQTLEGGQTLIHLQPVGDASNFGYAVLDGSTLNTYIFQPNTQPIEAATPAGEQMDFRGHPVEIHSGVCEDYTAEPIYDVGDFVQTNVYAEGEQEAGDLEGEIPQEAQELGPVYKLESEGADFGDEGILDQGAHVVAVHQSPEEFGTLVACGQILPVMDDDNVVVFLHPVGGSNQAGFIEMGQDGSDARGFLWELESFNPVESQSTPVPGATPAPVVTQEPEASPTPEATAVIVETQVVSAATATAIAEGTPADEIQTDAVSVDIGGGSAEAISGSANQVITLSNGSENERTFAVSDLDINTAVGGGQQAEVLIPEDVEPGTYTYQILEGEEVVSEGELTIQ